MLKLLRRTIQMHPVDLAAYPSPGMSPTLAPTWRVGRDVGATWTSLENVDPGHRKRKTGLIHGKTVDVRTLWD